MKTIENHKEYLSYLDRAEQITNDALLVENNESLLNELLILSILIEQYEDRVYSVA